MLSLRKSVAAAAKLGPIIWCCCRFSHGSRPPTGTCFTEVRTALQRLGWQPTIDEIADWADHPEYAKLRRMVDAAVRRAEAERGDPETIHIVFSAFAAVEDRQAGRSVPAGHPTNDFGVTHQLNRPWSLAFQSRNGKMPWLEPYLDDELKRLGHAGIRRVVVVPISFVSDHIETLFELDQLYSRVAMKSGITHYYRACCFNDDPEFPRVLNAILVAAGAVPAPRHTISPFAAPLWT